LREKLLLFILFIFISFKGNSQQFYAANSLGQLLLVTITNNVPTFKSVQGCGDYQYFSIAIAGNKIYYNTVNGNLYSADITTGTYPITNCKLISAGVAGNALTIDQQGKLYYAYGYQLYSIDSKSANPVPKLLGIMPYSAGGDLAFFNNQLYMAAPEGIVAVNLSDPSKSKLYISIPGTFILGLANVIKNGQNVMYAFDSESGGTMVLELDMQNKTVAGVVGTVPFAIFDAGSATEAGIVARINISSFNISQACDVFNKANVVVVCKPDTSQYKFTLNTGQSNTTGIFNNLAPGTYQLNITSSGVPVPTDTSFMIPDFTLNNPVITATLKNPICDIAGTIKLDAGIANTAYSIKYGNNTFGFDHKFTGLVAGTYHFTILNSKGCIADEKDYLLRQDACPPIVISNIQVDPECDVFGRARITVTTSAHPDNYTYTLNNVSDTTGVFNFIKPGTYDLTITSSGGDKAEQQVIVPDYTLNKPAITYLVKNAECALPGEIQFTINGNSDGATTIKHGTDIYPLNQTIKNLSPGYNYFSVLNQGGCVVDTLLINIPQDECIPIVFPNAFTPNADGINDVFRPNQNSDPVVYQLLIYDRWGALIFQSKSLYTGWDGKHNGKPAPYGVYYWVAKYTMPDNKNSTQSGYVTLIK
jgi:gliding motility-associated-like protein